LEEVKMLSRTFLLVNFILVSAALSGLYSQYPAQNNQSKILNQQAEELISFSDYVFGKDVRLVNGRIYSQPQTKAYGHPFIKGSEWMQGSVDINGKNFSSLKLNYDIYQDYLIYLDESPDGNKVVLLLDKNKVTNFTLEDHSFITLRPSGINNITESQYFEILYEGEVSLFNRWIKKFEVINTQEFPAGRFLETKITRYLMKDNELRKVSNRFVLLKLCEDRKGEIRKYLRRHRIYVRKAQDEQLAGLIEYYNSLITD
jgi:hypothetical protein